MKNVMLNDGYAQADQFYINFWIEEYGADNVIVEDDTVHIFFMKPNGDIGQGASVPTNASPLKTRPDVNHIPDGNGGWKTE